MVETDIELIHIRTFTAPPFKECANCKQARHKGRRQTEVLNFLLSVVEK